jgi:hypothetical protein
MKARCIGRCAGCSCGRDSAARLGLPVVGKFVAARMPEHVRMQWEGHLGGLAEPLDEMVEVRRSLRKGANLAVRDDR